MESAAGEDQLDAEPRLSNGAMDTDEDFSEADESRPITFLDLPYNVKVKILEYAGLLRPCLINIGHENVRPKHDTGVCSKGNSARGPRQLWTGPWVDRYHGPCDHPGLPLDVFLSSRAAHRELKALFFAQNRFSMYIYGRTEYNLFCAATRSGLQHLKQLHLDLVPRENRYLKLSGSNHRMYLNIWKSFCQDAKERMPSLRCFSLRVKVKDLEVATRLMCTMDPFPRLTHCAFHFNPSENDDIRPVIKRAAWRLTGRLENRGTFPFLKLPKEVQLLILEHLLLGFSDPYLPASERVPGFVSFIQRQSEQIGSPLACCGTCSPLRAMCFCHARQTAYSTSCTCFSSPVRYFLVSRGFYQDCRRVFFSKNRFMFVEDDPESIMRFLYPIPTSSFLMIRHLSFKFPLTDRVYPKGAKSEETALLSWSVLRRFIREHFFLPRLSLVIMDLAWSKNNLGIRTTYMRKMLKEFADLRGLREFKLYLADDRSAEKELERVVMGRAATPRYKPYRPLLTRTQSA